MTTTTTTNAMGSNANSNSRKTLPTHELFDVQERPGQKPFWNKVGAAFQNKDGSHSVLVYQPGIPVPKRLQLRTIDRAIRPLKEGADPKKSPTHELFVVVDVEDAPNEWKRVGVGFTNKDGSLSLLVDDGNREGPKARFQLRLRRDRPANDDPAASASPAPPAPAAASSPESAPATSASRSVVRRRQNAAA